MEGSKFIHQTSPLIMIDISKRGFSPFKCFRFSGFMSVAEEMTVEDVCTLATYTATPESLLDEVVLNMADRQIGSVLVLDGDELAGIFTATDACRYLGQCLRGEL